jgi:hypothetical protein
MCLLAFNPSMVSRHSTDNFKQLGSSNKKHLCDIINDIRYKILSPIK